MPFYTKFFTPPPTMDDENVKYILKFFCFSKQLESLSMKTHFVLRDNKNNKKDEFRHHKKMYYGNGIHNFFRIGNNFMCHSMCVAGGVIVSVTKKQFIWFYDRNVKFKSTQSSLVTIVKKRHIALNIIQV